MTERLEVKVAGQHGMPYVQVPREAMWDLVEYLSFHRTMVLYSYQTTHFKIEFVRLDETAAQEMLDAWAGQEAGAEGGGSGHAKN